jgi:hypothetical protein|tara:strand:+ start:504 stop:833 length:330 start_codon:yes stop_codon:yes gene_type:complete
MINESIILKNKGINAAVDNANKTIKGWSQMAANFLIDYMESNDEFMAEDVRLASRGIVPEPPSKRAWGSIFSVAAKNNIIKRIGYNTVKNPKAHGTPASVWQVVGKNNV